MNYSLWKFGMKSNYKVFCIFLAILTLYITLIISIFNPQNSSILTEFVKTMPEIMSMMGMTGDFSSLIGFQVTYLYGFLLLLLPFVVLMMIAHKLFASLTDKGSMAYILATPNTRGCIARTQLIVLFSFLVVMIGYCTIVAVVASSLMFPNTLDMNAFLRLNSGLFCLHFCLSGIAVLISVISNESKVSLLFGAGLPVLFFLIQMLSNMGGKLEFLKYVTIFKLFDGMGLVSGNSSAIFCAGILLFLGFILYYFSFKIFKKKDFSI